MYSVSTDEGFSTPLPPDEVEVEYDGEGMTIKWGEGIGGEECIRDACVDAICSQLGSVCARQLVEEGLAALVNDSPGESDDGDDDPDDADTGPDIDESELIAQKTEFERDFILEFRDLFSESLSPNRYLRAPPIHISLKNSRDRSRDPALYRFKPDPFPYTSNPKPGI